MHSEKLGARFGHRLRAAFLAAATLFLALATHIAFAPQDAHAATIADLQAQIDGKQAEIDALELASEDADAALAEIVKKMYETKTPGLATAFTADDFSEIINNVEYANDMYAVYQAAAENAEDAKDAIPAKQKEIDELQQRIDNRLNRDPDTVQFPQGGGMPWSGVFYWTGSIARSGCGLCAYTVVVDILTGADYTPDEMLKIRGDWSGTEASMDSRFGTPDGQTHQQWSVDYFDITTKRVAVSRSSLNEALADDGESAAIILARGNSVFKNKDGSWRSSSGHFVVCYRIDGEGNYRVHDSAVSSDLGMNVVYSPSDMDRLLSGTNAIIAFHN